MEVGKHDFIFDVVALLCDSACLIYNSFFFFFLKFSFSQSFSVWLMNTCFFFFFCFFSSAYCLSSYHRNRRKDV